MLKPGIVLTLLLVAAGCGGSPQEAVDPTSPYAGEQARVVKALSAEEVEDYLSGQGMGLAKAAELNHYPGPRHVLTLAGDLDLSDDQRAETQAVFEQMKARAVDLGRRIVEKEAELDALFAGGDAGSGRVHALVRDLGALQADLRFAHLEAHLKMKALLTDEQVQRYDQLRGYDASAPPGQHHPGEMHH